MTGQRPMNEYGLIFLAGMAASWHCIGMCGGFACALAGNGCSGLGLAQRQLLYNIGRVTTYCFLGALAGALAAGLCGASPAAGGMPINSAQRILAIVSGLLIIFVGLQFFGPFRRLLRGSLTGFGGETLASALRQILRTPSPFAPLAFGVANGFLPCPLVYAFLGLAAASGGPVPGMTLMLVFGLGTFPAMLLMGGLGGWLQRRTAPVAVTGTTTAHGILSRADWRRHAATASGAVILLLGLITLARGLLPMHSHGIIL